jgi:hypothetical protein
MGPGMQGWEKFYKKQKAETSKKLRAEVSLKYHLAGGRADECVINFLDDVLLSEKFI